MKKLIIFFTVGILTIQANWAQESQENKMKWWDEAKFGMFIHWGVYSDLAGMWEGEPVRGYAEHIMRKEEIPLETYKKEVAANFNPTKFNAEEWVKTCKAAGMKYMVITSKHHDGFAMFDTNVKGWENYDIVDGTKFKRDPMLELKEACDKHGIKFGFYYSHAQDWSHEYGQRNDWDFNQPTSKKPAWYGMPEWKHHIEKTGIYVKEKSIPQLKEILSEKYDPDIIWFDTSSWIPQKYNEQIMKAAREVANSKVIFNSRLGTDKSFADYSSTCDKPAEFRPTGERYWEAIPTTNSSYGYHKMDNTHKPASHFIELLSKASARGGNLLMNVGPKGDGTIASIDVEILTEIGDWLKINGDAIYASKKTSLPVQSWGETSINENNLYLHIHDYPESELTLTGLKNSIEKAYILSDSSKKPLSFKRTKSGKWIIDIPEKQSEELLPIVVVQCKEKIEYNGDVRLITPNQTNTFHIFDGKLSGDKIRFGSGSDRENFLTNWSSKNAYVYWKNKIETKGEFDVYITYDSEKDSENNQFEIQVGANILKANVVPKSGFKKIKIGTVKLKNEIVPISVKPTNISTKQLMQLRNVILEPISKNQ